MKNFFICFLFLTIIYFLIPKVGSLISFFGAIVLICQLSCVLVNFIFRSKFFPKLLIPSTNRLVLITGCDSGFGLATAKRLDYYGFHVIASVLSKESEGAKYLETYASKRLHIIKLDITKQEDIQEAVDLVAYLTNFKPILDKVIEKQANVSLFDRKFQKQIFGNLDGELKLWALINNAGLALYSPFEFGTIEQDIKPMFDVNVFGLINMTKAFTPFIRQSQGRIINVSSLADRFTVAYLTGYAMTKHAVRSFSDGLRQELNKFNVKVMIIEPTLYNTPISSVNNLKGGFDKTFEKTEEHIRNDYGNEKFKERFIQHIKKLNILTRNNINEVVDNIEDAVINANPKNEYVCAGLTQKIAIWFGLQFNLEFINFFLKLRSNKNIIKFIKNFV